MAKVVNKQEAQAIIALYKANPTQPHPFFEKHFRRSWTAIGKVLIDAGLYTVKPVRVLTKEIKAEIVRLKLEDHLTDKEIAQKLGYNRVSINRFWTNYREKQGISIQQKATRPELEDFKLIDYSMQTPCFKRTVWKPKKVVFHGKQYYDMTAAKMSDGFPMYGIEVTEPCKLPYWKRDFARKGKVNYSEPYADYPDSMVDFNAKVDLTAFEKVKR